MITPAKELGTIEYGLGLASLSGAQHDTVIGISSVTNKQKIYLSLCSNFLWNGHSVLAFLPIVFISARAWAQLSIEVACNTLTPRLSTLRWWCCSCSSSLPNKRPIINKRVVWFQMLQLYSSLPNKRQRIHTCAVEFLIFLIKPYESLELKISPMGQNFVVFTKQQKHSCYSNLVIAIAI